jgi:hypothetical protein
MDPKQNVSCTYDEYTYIDEQFTSSILSINEIWAAQLPDGPLELG